MTFGLNNMVEFYKDFALRTLTHNSLASLESTLSSKPFYLPQPFFLLWPEQVLLKGICVSTAA